MIIVLVLFVAFGAQMQTLHDVNEMCWLAKDSGPVCLEIYTKTVSTNPTPLGQDD